MTEDFEKYDMLRLMFKSPEVLTATFEGFKQGAMLGGDFINLGKR